MTQKRVKGAPLICSSIIVLAQAFWGMSAELRHLKAYVRQHKLRPSKPRKPKSAGEEAPAAESTSAPNGVALAQTTIDPPFQEVRSKKRRSPRKQTTKVPSGPATEPKPTRTKSNTGEHSLPVTSGVVGTASGGPQSRLCYARAAIKGAVTAAIRRLLPMEKPQEPSLPKRSCTIKVTATQSGLSGAQVREKLIATVKPREARLQVGWLQKVRGAVLVDAFNTESRDRFLVLPTLAEAGLQAIVLEAHWPRMKVYDVPSRYSKEELLSEIVACNFEGEESKTIREGLSLEFKDGPNDKLGCYSDA